MADTLNWVRTADELPEENTWVETMIYDGTEVRQRSTLFRKGLVWFRKDDFYVYYTPTHWRYKVEKNTLEDNLKRYIRNLINHSMNVDNNANASTVLWEVAHELKEILDGREVK